MSRLPQELIDDIIDHVHSWNEYPLKACSLVCSQWSTRSRKHLFMQVELRSRADLERWCAHIHPGPSGPSSLVEDLSLLDHRLSMSNPSGAPWTSPSKSPWLRLPVISKAAPHLQSFSGLQALRVVGWDTFAVPVSLMLHCIGPPSENVTRLTLERMFIRSSALMTFVSHFPHLHYLFISTIMRPWEADGTGVSHHESHDRIVPTHPRGEFTAFEVKRFDEPEEVFRGIALLEPRFSRIAFKGVRCAMWRNFWPVVEACAGSLEELEIEPISIGVNLPRSLIAIRSCQFKMPTAMGFLSHAARISEQSSSTPSHITTIPLHRTNSSRGVSPPSPAPSFRR